MNNPFLRAELCARSAVLLTLPPGPSSEMKTRISRILQILGSKHLVKEHDALWKAFYEDGLGIVVDITTNPWQPFIHQMDLQQQIDWEVNIVPRWYETMKDWWMKEDWAPNPERLQTQRVLLGPNHVQYSMRRPGLDLAAKHDDDFLRALAALDQAA